MNNDFLFYDYQSKEQKIHPYNKQIWAQRSKIIPLVLHWFNKPEILITVGDAIMQGHFLKVALTPSAHLKANSFVLNSILNLRYTRFLKKTSIRARGSLITGQASH